MSDLISVIIPAYNVERYLDDCLKSVTFQSYDNLEIIIVDDGSTDGTASICDEWAEKDSRIIVFHTPKYGLSVARNKGLDVAKGQYISFIDSDDYFEPDAIESLYKTAKFNNADMVVAQGRKVTEIGELIEQGGDDGTQKVINEEDFWRRYSDNLYYIVIWSKLYRASLFENIRFPIGVINEDVEVSRFTASAAGVIVSLNKCIYNYRIRDGSITRSPFGLKNLYVISAIHDIIDYVMSQNFKDETKRYVVRIQFTRALKYMGDAHVLLDKKTPDKRKRLKKLYDDYKPVARLLLHTIGESSKPDLSTKITMLTYLFNENLFFFFRRIKRGNREW